MLSCIRLRSSQEVAQSAAQLGLNGMELSNLSEPVCNSSSRGLEADEEAQINVLRAQLQNQMQQPMQEQQRKAVLTCLQASVRAKCANAALQMSNISIFKEWLSTSFYVSPGCCF